MVFLTILVYSINLAISNKKENTKDCEIKDNKIYGFSVIGIFLISFVLDFLNTKIKLPIWLYLIVAFLETSYFIFENTKRENTIRQKHEELKKVIQCLAPVIEVAKGEEIDLEGDYGFKMAYDEKTGEMNRIECEMKDPDKWEGNILTKVVINLNKYICNRQWTSQADYSKLHCVFVGTELPPTMAKYPGTWLRPWNYFPLGVNGTCELGINLGAKEQDLGEPCFVYEDGRIAKTILPPKISQVLVAGATGGGKAIWINQPILINDV